MKKKPNKFLAPVVIAGVTIGFFVSAYKFVFAKNPSDSALEQSKTQPQNPTPEHIQESSQGQEPDSTLKH